MKCPTCDGTSFTVMSLAQVWRRQDVTFYLDGGVATFKTHHEEFEEIEQETWKSLYCQQCKVIVPQADAQAAWDRAHPTQPMPASPACCPLCGAVGDGIPCEPTCPSRQPASGPITATDPRVLWLLAEWHEAGRKVFERRYPYLDYDRESRKTAKEKDKYLYLDEGSGGAFLVERLTGRILRIKSAYGRPNPRKVVGQLGDVTGECLCLHRWW